jgi:hypothetical protein
MSRRNSPQRPTFYLTPHGVQPISGVEDLEDESGSIVIPTLDGEPIILTRVEFN